MTTVVVLFNLRPGVTVAEYERFARDMDLPEVNRLPSVASFEVLKCQGLLGGGASPFQYIEILKLKSLEQLGQDTQSPIMQKVVSTFQSLADNPQFIVTAAL
jgi:hypothetical protein